MVIEVLAPSSDALATSDAPATSSFLLLVVRPGAPSSLISTGVTSFQCGVLRSAMR